MSSTARQRCSNRTDCLAHRIAQTLVGKVLRPKNANPIKHGVFIFRNLFFPLPIRRHLSPFHQPRNGCKRDFHALTPLYQNQHLPTTNKTNIHFKAQRLIIIQTVRSSEHIQHSGHNGQKTQGIIVIIAHPSLQQYQTQKASGLVPPWYAITFGVLLLRFEILSLVPKSTTNFLKSVGLMFEANSEP